MKKVDPARYIGKRKAAEMEIKTLGTPPPLEPIRLSPSEKKESRTTALQKSSSAEVQQYSILSLDNLDDYPLLDFREYKKIDARLTWDQKEYLDNLERLIVRDAPGVEKSNPLSKRITRSSIIRALVEIARRLQITVNPSRFQNERDLIEAIVEAFEQKFRKPEDKKVQ